MASPCWNWPAASYDDLLLVVSGESSVASENSPPQPDADDIARDTSKLKGQARCAYDGKQ
ncbi:hypothetical protein [Janthinobacterium agaricidamnosum]|uniref:Uncharacterized protein n=1 Tax=Janthinobacterium agaricidamnosum NBRC 102515 = DSM 9628 TaxID=1349767 RepID=W0V1D0_9BURK|nr:hypothetical protein [Janthinobacterium agaricidamnosum]CDG81681.1 hypothetical protein GJA_1026 [Janthinobacterium agaricidamnosum NBRC 102515 = DSM 9628]